MRKALIASLVSVLVMGGLVVFFFLEGRYLVEGGRAPWAVINDEPAVLDEALAAGIDQAEKDAALSHAVSRGRAAMLRKLVAQGARVNPAAKGHCALGMSIHHPSPDVVRTLLEAGADPALCTGGEKLMADFLSNQHDAAPQAELIQVLWLMHQKGLSADQAGPAGSARQLAARYKLDEVSAFLEHPSAPADAPRPAADESPAADISRDELKAVCAGQGVPAAPAYEKRAERVSPVLVLERRHETYRWPGAVVPRFWTPGDEPGRTQLVACVEAVDKQVIHECRYEGPGGGLSIYAAGYTLRLVEARSGEELARQAVPAKRADTRCPELKFDRDQEGRFPDYTAELEAFARPFLGGPERAAN
jgi:hypothetical protein